MFLPTRMTRIVAGGHKQHLDAFINVLHRERVVHLEDFADPTGTTSIGTPLEAGDAASAHLVRVRGLLKSLDAEDAAPTGQDPHDPAEIMRDAEAELVPVIDELSDARASLAAVRTEMQQLAPYEALDVELSAVTGLRSVRVFVGQARDDPRAALGRLGADVQVAEQARRTVVAAIVPAARAEEAERVLADHGFTAAQLPDTSGTPAARLHALASQQQRLKDHVAEVSGRLDGLRDAWAGRLAALEERLADEVDRTQAPLRFAVTKSTFHAEGWVPTATARSVISAVQEHLGDQIYIEDIGDAPDSHGAPLHASAKEHHTEPEEEPPVKLENKGLATPYEFLLGLLGRPRYKEIDPTKLMLFFFPLFFGLMVGDIVVGLAIALLGQVLKTKRVFGIGGPAVGRALVMGGVMSVVFGLVVFGEGLGIHFVVDDHAVEEGELSWEVLMYGDEAVLAGHGFPEDGFIHKTGHGADAAHAVSSGSAEDALHASPGYMPLQEEVEEESSAFTLTPHSDTHLSVGGWFNLGYYSKIHDITALLIWSLIIGVVHIVLGLVIGVRNVAVSHGPMLAVQEKVSWLLLLLVATPALAFGAAKGDNLWLAVGVGALVFSVALLWQGVKKALGAPGFVALLEVPSIFGNLLSYTRLAAIGASKAGMAIAFSAIGFLLSGDQVNALWWGVYLFGMIVITLLAVLSGGLQSLRLQFVEFFSKFYEGGGRPYLPFGRRSP